MVLLDDRNRPLRRRFECLKCQRLSVPVFVARSFRESGWQREGDYRDHRESRGREAGEPSPPRATGLRP